MSYDAIVYAKDRLTPGELKDRINRIFEDLAPLFDRIEDSLVNQYKKEYPNFNEALLRVGLSLQIYFELPLELTLSDFDWEQKRLNSVGSMIPDVPTFHLQFGINEGSWIKLLRNELREFLIEKRKKLNNVEEDLLISHQHSTDSAAVHVVEQLVMEKNYIAPILAYWKDTHQSSTYVDAAYVLLAALHQKKIEEAIDIYKKGLALFERTVNLFEEIFEPHQKSSWVERGIKQVSQWKELLKENPENLEIVSQIVIAAIPRPRLQALFSLIQGKISSEEIEQQVKQTTGIGDSLLLEFKGLYNLDLPPREWQEEIMKNIKSRIEGLRKKVDPEEYAKNIFHVLLLAPDNIDEKVRKEELEAFVYGIGIIKRDSEDSFDFQIRLMEYLEQYASTIVDKYWMPSRRLKRTS